MPRPPELADASHDVRARREGADAILECQACQGRGRIREGEFDALNAFVDRHRACVS